MRRANAVAIILAFILGLTGGLIYSWILSPVEYTDTAPASLRQDFKEDYLSLIASAYQATGDLNQARARLTLLGISAAPEELSRLAQSRLAAGRPESEARALAQLAAVLGERPSPLVLTPSPTPELSGVTPRPSPTMTATATRIPTRTPTSTPGAPFVLINREAICDPELLEAQLQVRVLDASGEGVPGIQILVVWDSGQDRFFTGLKPELGAGYADFTMEPDTTYSLQLLEGESPVTGLTAEECTDETGQPYQGSWLLTFQQP